MDDDHMSLYHRPLWLISYGPYHMAHIIWTISDEPYRMTYPSAIRNLCQNEHTKE